MDDDLDLSSDLESFFNNGGSRHRSSGLLNDRLAQVRRVAEQSERQRHLSFVHNSELRNKLNTLRKQVGSDDPSANDEILTNDGDLHPRSTGGMPQHGIGTRTKAIEGIEHMQEPSNVESDVALHRELELEAALQAERQRAAVMLKTLEERERALNDLEAQCESLGNDLEDREREMDHLTRKIEQAQTTPPSPKLGSQDKFGERAYAPSAKAISDNSLGISELFNADSFDREPKAPIPWQLIGKTLAAVLVVGVAGVLGVLFWSHPLHITYTHISNPHLAMPSQPSPLPGSLQNTQIPPQTVAIATLPPSTAVTVSIATAPVYVIPPPLRDSLRSGGKGPKMLKLPSGKFFMGSKAAFTAEPEEQPFHEVTLKAFYMASYETTFDEYDQFARATGRTLPSDNGFGRGNRPVINVTWGDAQAYVQWLSAETGYNYYLPSEAQWEYAARGGTGTYYWWGNKAPPGYAICFSCGTPWDGRSTAPVGSLKPNPFGLYDTAGNVMELTQDCYNADYNGAPNDGNPWLSGDCSQHIVRGGAFNKPITAARSDYRFKLPIEDGFNMLGFRVARD